MIECSFVLLVVPCGYMWYPCALELCSYDAEMRRQHLFLFQADGLLVLTVCYIIVLHY